MSALWNENDGKEKFTQAGIYLERESESLLIISYMSF
jgi:hypothetical protein